MTDTFSSCEITPNGISIKVGTHRSAIGVKDFATKADYITAVAKMLEDHMGPRLAAVAAVVSSREDDKEQAITALKAEHDARCATLEAEYAAHCERLEADIAALGTKEEAQAIRERQQVDLLRRTMSDAAAQLAVLEKRSV